MSGFLLTMIFLLIYVSLLFLFSKMNIIFHGQLKGFNLIGYIDFELYGLKLYTLKIGSKPRTESRNKPSLFFNRHNFYRCIEHYAIRVLKTDINIGLDDAAKTAVSVGIVHSFAACFYTFLSNYIIIEKVDYDIRPVYSGICFDVDFLCIIEVKIVNIIIDILYVRLRHFEEHKILKGRIEYG